LCSRQEPVQSIGTVAGFLELKRTGADGIYIITKGLIVISITAAYYTSVRPVAIVVSQAYLAAAAARTVVASVDELYVG